MNEVKRELMFPGVSIQLGSNPVTRNSAIGKTQLKYGYDKKIFAQHNLTKWVATVGHLGKSITRYYFFTFYYNIFLDINWMEISSFSVYQTLEMDASIIFLERHFVRVQNYSAILEIDIHSGSQWRPSDGNWNFAYRAYFKLDMDIIG